MQIVDTSQAEPVVELDPAGIVLLNFRWREPSGWTRWLWEDEAGRPLYEMASAEDASGLIRTVDRLECQGVFVKTQAEDARLAIRGAVFAWKFGHRLALPGTAAFVDKLAKPQVLWMEPPRSVATGGGLGVSAKSVGDSPVARVGQSDPPPSFLQWLGSEPFWWSAVCWLAAAATAFFWALWA
jgi:hypothetical protein